MNPVHLILGEVNNVLSSMRLNKRWSSPSQPDALLTRFLHLKATLLNFSSLDSMVYCVPFLKIISSRQTSGPITGLGLNAIAKFLTNLLTEASPNIAATVNAIARKVTHSRFEATDPDSDEVILMKIVQVLQDCLCRPVGRHLTDEWVFEIFQTAYRMTSQQRLGQLLRRYSEAALQRMLEAVFRNPAPSIAPLIARPDAVELMLQQTQDFEHPHAQRQTKAEDAPLDPHGDISLQRIFGFICTMVDPLTPNVSEEAVVIGLGLATHVLELLGHHVVVLPWLVNAVNSDLARSLCVHLGARSPALLVLTLRAWHTLICSGAPHFQAAIDAFLATLLKQVQSINPRLASTPDTGLEALQDLLNVPGLAVSLFANFDCNKSLPNYISTFVEHLYKAALPVEGRLYLINMQAMEVLLSLAQGLSRPVHRLTKVDVATLLAQQSLKALHRESAALFASSPEQAWVFVGANRLADPSNPKEVARFLSDTSSLDGVHVGNFLGKKKHKEVLVEFIKYHCEKQRGFMPIMRAFLQNFNIPGESPIIEYMMETASQLIFETLSNQGDNPFCNADQLFVFCYAILMLNVDAHNPNVKVKEKMTKEQFVRMVTNQKVGNETLPDLPLDFITEVYESVKNNEIHVTPESFPAVFPLPKNAWTDVLIRGTNLEWVESPTGLEAILFASSAPKIMAALVSGWDSHPERTLAGLELLASTAASLGNASEFIDKVVITLAQLSGLEKLSVDREESLVRWGRSPKSQKATVALFKFVVLFGDSLRDAWRNVLSGLVALDFLHLLSDALPIRLTVAAKQPEREQRRPTAGWGALASWFSAESGPTQEDTAAQARARDTVSEANIRAVLTGSASVSTPSFECLLRGLLALTVETKDQAAAFALELLVNVALINRTRVPWERLERQLLTTIRSGLSHPSLLSEAAMLAPIAIATHSESTQLLEALLLEPIEPYAEKLAPAIGFLVSSKPTLPFPLLQALLRFLAARETTAPTALTAVQQLCATRTDTLVPLLAVLTARTCPSVVSIQAMQLLYTTTMSQLDPSAPFASTRESLLILAGLGTDPRSDVRHYALTYLQRALVAPELNFDSHSWVLTFDQIVFPLLNQLLEQTGIEAGPLEETRLRASVVLCKTFLQQLPVLSTSPDFSRLWFDLLTHIHRFMEPQSELLTEAVPESLKNVLLVMFAGGLFDPSLPICWAKIATFCPTLKDAFAVTVGLAQPEPVSPQIPPPSVSTPPPGRPTDV